eukprot:2505627-Alexandrium_andersonii.AAC.1
MATFDGGTRVVGTGRAAGAGAALLLDCATVALPSIPHAQEAEAWGARLALHLLLRQPPRV